MSNSLTPMLHVKDIAQSMGWYQKVGFEVLMTNQKWQPDAEVNWCLLQLQGNKLMLNCRHSDLTENLTLSLEISSIDTFYDGLPTECVPVYAPTDQFYGRRDFELRTPNGNSLLFGQPL